MAIKDLVGFLGKENIVDDVKGLDGGKEMLAALAERVKRQFNEDLGSMGDWIDSVEKGIDLMKQEYNAKSTPWDGASNFKSPLLSEASISFGDKASLELIRMRNLIKTDIIGRDLQGQKREASERVTEAMNYQINHGMKGWRKEQKRLLYVLPNVGCLFKKTVFDPTIGENVSHTIQYPDFAINQATTSMEDCRSFTQILSIDKNGVKIRQNAGIWIDEDIYPEDAEGDEGGAEKNNSVDSADNPDRFLEQHCFADLDDDSLEEPYIVTLHEGTGIIVRIVPLYDERSFVIKSKTGQVMNLVKWIQSEAAKSLAAGITPEEPDFNSIDLVRINKLDQLTKYGFIPSPDGTFLDLGYSHLLGAIVQGINTTTNQLTDSGTLRNVGGGFLAKGFRKKMGPLRMKPGNWVETNIGPASLRSGLLPNPNPEPSVVLFQLNERLEQQGRNFASVVDVSGQINANTAPTTALAILQEALISTSALMGRVIDSMSDEFRILFKLNQRTFDPELYKTILDDPDADFEQDFNNQSLDIIPTASPEMSSKLQRIQLATVELAQVQSVVTAGGNPMPIIKSFFERIGSDNVDEIFPEEPTDKQAEEMKRFNDAKDMENQIAQSQLELANLQTEILSREQDRLDADTERKIQETASKIKKDLADIILTLEKAETEDVKNNVSVYTARINAAVKSLTAIGADNARRNDPRDQSQTGQAPNQPGVIRPLA